jgi:hypothetical protein
VSDFQIIAAASVVSVLIVALGLVLAARRERARHIDEPTDMLPIFEDPVAQAFDEATRILRGDTDTDFAALYDRRRLRAYEGDFQTLSIRRLTRRLARLDQT